MNMDWLDSCSASLIVPNITESVLSAVIASKNNANSTVMLFKHPEDVSNARMDFEQIGFVYTIGARTNPTDLKLPDGSVEKRAVNVGGIQLRSLLIALGEDNPAQFLTLSRDELVDEMQRFVGCAVTHPMSGRVKSKKGDVYINFKFPDLDYSDPELFADSLAANADAFGPSDLDLAVHREAAQKRLQRPDTGVVPVGAEEGDEIVS